MTTVIKSRVEISTDCQCYHCQGCDVGWVGRPEDGRCVDCGGELQSMTYCDGTCWEDASYIAEEMLTEYVASNEDTKRLRIEGRRMGWRNLSGWADVRSDWESLLNALRIDGDFTIRMEIDGDGIFTARRYSHDEPTGAYFSIYPIKHLPDTMDLDEAIQREIVDEYGCHKGCGNYFYDCECEAK